MKVILYMAVSANGFIARENGSEDFLSNKNWKTFIELAKKAGNFIYGRKTYESVITWGKEYVDDIEKIETKLLVSENFSETPKHGFIHVHSPKEAIKFLEEKGFSEIILTGGSTNNTSFAKEGLIDEVIFNIEPAIIGKGIPVFKPEDFEMKLQLEEFKKIENGLLQVRYIVVK